MSKEFNAVDVLKETLNTVKRIANVELQQLFRAQHGICVTADSHIARVTKAQLVNGSELTIKQKETLCIDAGIFKKADVEKLEAMKQGN